MWTERLLFRERRSIPSKILKTYKLTTVGQISGGAIPSFESYIYPRLEESAKYAPKTAPLIISLHLYPPVPVYNYNRDSQIQKKVIPDLNRFFDRNRHVCVILISSYAQLALPMGGNKQTVLTPAWEIESPYWSGERPDYDPSAPSY